MSLPQKRVARLPSVFSFHAWPVSAAILAAIALVIAVGNRSELSAHGDKPDDSNAADLDLPRTVSPETAAFIGLKTAIVDRQPMGEVLELTGMVKPLPNLNHAVASQFAGTILAIHKRIGERVKKGDVLVRIDSLEKANNVVDAGKLAVERQKLLLEIERTKLEAAQALPAIRVAQSQLEHYKLEYNRFKDLEKQNKTTAVDVAMREENLIRGETALKLRKMESELSEKSVVLLTQQADAIEALIQTLQGLTDDHQQSPRTVELRASADGVITQSHASPGQWAASGQTILEYADVSIVQVEADAPEAEIGRIMSKNPRKAIVVCGTQQAEGSVIAFSPEVDLQRRVMKIFIETPNASGAFLNNMWVSVRLQLTEPKPMLAIPASAVGIDGPVRYVFVENGGQYQKQDITPGIANPPFVEVKQGLVPGDTVVVNGVHALSQMRPVTRRLLPATAESSARKPGR